MEPRKKQLTGTVTRSRISPGSKSDRIGVVLRTGGGEEYVLRRRGGNAFRDEKLEALVGDTITGTGLVVGQTFIMSNWKAKRGG